jgi:hypothetical protein
MTLPNSKSGNLRSILHEIEIARPLRRRLEHAHRYATKKQKGKGEEARGVEDS